MIRWIFLKIVGIFLPSLISKAVSPGQQATSNIALNVEFKILDKELGDKIPLPKFSTAGSAALDLRTNIKEKKFFSPMRLFFLPLDFQYILRILNMQP